MIAIYPAIKQLGGEVLAVSFTRPDQVATFLAKYPQPFPVVADPTRAAYQAFALGKTTVRSFFRFDILWHYLRLIFRGWMPARPDKDADLLQLGGDFILDRAGRLRYAHPSQDASDRPSTAELLAAMEQAAAAE